MYKLYNYPPEIYEMKRQGYIKKFSQYVGFGSLTFLLIGFLSPIGKLIIMECLAVIQISFFSLMQLDLMPITYEELKYLIYSSGYFDLNKILPIDSIQ